MNPDENLSEYTVRDYSAIDQQIMEIARRESALTNRIRIDNFRRIAWVLIMVAGALALIIISIGIAMRLMEPAPIMAFNEPQKIDITVKNEPLTVQVEGRERAVDDINTPPPAEMFKPPESGYSDDAKLESQKTSKPPLIGITKFINVESGLVEYGDVVSGWNYEDSNTAVPHREYCYVMKRSDSSISEQINLAIKNQNEKPEDLFDISTVQETGLSKSQWAALLRKCQWFSG
jgi:hypothetical protein